ATRWSGDDVGRLRSVVGGPDAGRERGETVDRQRIRGAVDVVLVDLKVVKIAAVEVVTIVVDLKVDLSVAIEVDADFSIDAEGLHRRAADDGAFCCGAEKCDSPRRSRVRGQAS